MSYGEILRTLYIELTSFYKNRIDLHGASFQQMIAIIVIPVEGIEMSGISEKLGIDNSTATRLIDRLVLKNWVLRSKEGQDKRVTMVELTDEGEKMQNLYEKELDKSGEAIMKIVSLNDRQQLIEAISQMNWIFLKINSIK
tara:strand:+ start:5178 stop:5600 length:423 start_codon:yes stop_codon:yes gene_type:complete